jgi:glycosyltransferase involved in cell wall biosynthesis
LVSDLKPEVIHSYCFYMNIMAWFLARCSKGIPIGSIRQDFTDERWRLGGVSGKIVGGLSARLPPAQIFNSWTAKLAAEECRGIFKPSQMYVVPNGVDVAALKPHPVSETRCLLAAGRLEDVKRWDRLLKVLSVISGRGLNFSLRLAGDGPLRRELELQARQLGLNGRVEFMGRRRDIPALLRESLFLIHTADAEGCPNVVLEAMSAGRAVVATDAGDIPRLIENGTTGFVVRRGDDTKLVDCIAKLLSDPDLCCRMGQAAREKAEREFGLDQLVSNTLAAYQAAGWHAHALRPPA